MKRVLKTTILTLIVSSCSLIGEKELNTEYTIVTSVEGANVSFADGKPAGQTPLILGFEQVKDYVDGRFVSFFIEKPGYFTRVVFIDITRSVNVKVDLDVDKKYSLKREKEIVLRNRYLEDKQKFYEHQKKFLMDAIGNYKKQLELVQENNVLLEKKLKSSDYKLSLYRARDDQKLKELKQKNMAIKSDENINGLLGKNLASQFNLEITKANKELAFCQGQLRLNQKAHHVKVVAPMRCPSSVKRYYSGPKSNKIIRELLTAQFLLLNNQVQQAKNVILKAEKGFPGVSAFYTLLAYIESSQGNNVKAKSYLKKSLHLDRNDQMAKRMLQAINEKKEEVRK